MSDENKGIIIPMEGTTSPNEMRRNMLNLASLAQWLSFIEAAKGNPRPAAVYAIFGMLAIRYFELLG